MCVLSVQVVRLLLECNAKLNKKDQYGNTPLIHACLCGNLETATTLLQVSQHQELQLTSNQQQSSVQLGHVLHLSLKGNHLYCS